MRQRKLQLEKTLHRVRERRRAFVDYALRCLEEEEVYSVHEAIYIVCHSGNKLCAIRGGAE